MLSESIRVPYRADDAFGTILVGSVLTVLTVVLLAVWLALLVVWPPVGLALTPVAGLPGLVMRGYLLAVVDSGIHHRASLSSFVGWGSLGRAGGKSTLLSALYLLPAAVLCGVAVGGGVATVSSSPGFDETAQALTGVLIMIAGFGLLIYGLVYLYVRPAARAVFAATGSLRAALGVRRVLRLAATGDYVTGWLIAMGVLVAGPTLLVPLFVLGVAVGALSPIAGLLTILVTLLVGFVLGFLLRVSAAWATGRGAATGIESLYPTAVPAASPTGEPTAANSETGSTVEQHCSEAAPAVQTGRDVGLSDPESADEPATGRAERSGYGSMPAQTDGNGASSVDGPDAGGPEETRNEDTERTDDTTDNREASADDSDDHGFVWGVDEETDRRD